ncbi:MAG TPA: type II toxin-antitoxin system VapC family toxin [Solirubrobacterales bacterium]|nr:type II toxin-antitoxin system VapC family toxin [Solirubrobacterales bacterium]
MLVIDASTAVDLCLASHGFAPLAGEDLLAPPLILSETLSVLHELRWRGEIPEDMADLALDRRSKMRVRIEQPPNLGEEAWRTADSFGWAKTYDAEYVALAKLNNCRLVTIDARLRRGADRLGFVVTPAEL